MNCYWIKRCFNKERKKLKIEIFFLNIELPITLAYSLILKTFQNMIMILETRFCRKFEALF